MGVRIRRAISVIGFGLNHGDANTLMRLGTVTTKVRRAASNPALRATFSTKEAYV
jgi:hypothetical protein